MRRIIDEVIPVGSPWGGPESVKYLCCFVSMLMRVGQEGGTEREIHARHERLYCLYLTVSGIGVSTVWSEGLEPCSHEQVVDAFFDDYIERTMSYAGQRHECVEAEAIRTETDAVKRRIVASIDGGLPVLACSPVSDWSIVAGYAAGGDTLIGWDGARTYWGPPVVKLDGYLDDGMFATTNWPQTVSRFVFVEGAAPPARASRDVIANLVRVMETQRSAGYDKEFTALLADDAYCGSVDGAGLRKLHNYVNQYVGWYAENRCFVASALDESFVDFPDIKDNRAAVNGLRRAGGYWLDTHDTCWEAWRALLATHRCTRPDDAPCGQCGGCLRQATDEDLAAFRSPERRRKIIYLLDVIDRNDACALEQLRRCLALL